MKPGTVVFDLPILPDRQGSLCFMQEQDHIPFAIDSVYWIYNFASEPFPHDHRVSAG